MFAFEQFLTDAANSGEAVNIMFEQRLFDLVGVLHRIADALTAEQIPYEVIGGLAVLIHVEEVSPELSSLTRDVDLMIHRQDLDRIKDVAAQSGFAFRHAAGVDMLIYGDAGRVCLHARTPTPSITPQRKSIHGKDVMVIPVADLLVMKLTSFRLKDQVHIKTMDAAGLLTPDVETSLTPELSARLKQVRDTE